MLSTRRRCAERMFDQGDFKVNVIVKGQTHYHVRSTSFEPLVAFTNNLAQMSSMMGQCALHMFD